MLAGLAFDGRSNTFGPGRLAEESASFEVVFRLTRMPRERGRGDLA